MEKISHRSLVTVLSLASNVLPYFGTKDQWMILMKSLWKESKEIWDSNEEAFLNIILADNRRKITLSTPHYAKSKLMKYCLKYFQVKLTDLFQHNCKLLYTILNQYDWSKESIYQWDFTKAFTQPGLSHLLLVNKLLSNGVEPNRIRFSSELIEDLNSQPQASHYEYFKGEGEEAVLSEFMVEDNIQWAKSVNELWEILRYNILLSMPYIETYESFATREYPSQIIGNDETIDMKDYK